MGLERAHAEFLGHGEGLAAVGCSLLALWRITPRQSTKSVSLDALAASLLDQLRTNALGKGAAQGNRSGTPCTIATEITGEGTDPTQPIPPAGDVHRALEALCSWHQTWKNAALHPWDPSTCLKIRHAPLSHVLYGLDRGRVVWSPNLFTKQGAGPRAWVLPSQLDFALPADRKPGGADVRGRGIYRRHQAPVPGHGRPC